MTSNDFPINLLPGADQVITAFGEWPSFHDSEVIELSLNRESDSVLKVHTWHTSDQTDQKGFFIRDINLVVCFWLQNIKDVELGGFNHQNVLAGLEVKLTEEGFELNLLPCFGLSGTIIAEKISVAIESI